MKTKKVLVVSHIADTSAQLLIQRLEEIGQPHQLVDLGTYPLGASASIDLSNETTINFTQNELSFSKDDVKSVWWRRPKGKARPPTDDLLQGYIELESEVFIGSLFNLLSPNILWVSEPEKTRLANKKPLQLQIAKQIGLRIPKTFISNHPSAVLAFLENNPNMPIIMKPVGTSFVRMSDDPDDIGRQNLAIYTRIVNKDQLLQNIRRVRNCPAIFQEAIMKEFDVRVTVIGNKAFAVKISHSENRGADDSNLDWRHHKLNRVYEKYQLPIELEKKCSELVKHLGLNFGAIDMCFSKERGHVFLEINPQGQWVPSETAAGYPVSKTLAEFLAK